MGWGRSEHTPDLRPRGSGNDARHAAATAAFSATSNPTPRAHGPPCFVPPSLTSSSPLPLPSPPSPSLEPDTQFRLAIGSYVEQYSNSVQIIKRRAQSKAEAAEAEAAAAAAAGAGAGGVGGAAPDCYLAAEFDHPYPCTKILWNPEHEGAASSAAAGGGGGGGGDPVAGSRDLLATTGDYLRIWSLEEDGTGGPGQLAAKKEALLNNNKNSEYCAPLTSFDWCASDPNLLGTCSIDTTCTIWDLTANTARTQLIAHDREVFDLAWSKGPHTFASCGADGSVRMFDLRSLEHSTIIYESPNLEALLRLQWNRQDSNYLATFQVDGRTTTLLDIRVPSVPIATLGGHRGCVNAVAWAPHSSCHICTAGDDSQALIWDLNGIPKRQISDPILAYGADGEINNLQWNARNPDWISICYRDRIQILRV